MKGNFWPGLHFSDLTDLNNQGLTWLNSIANVRVHGTTGVTPFSRLGQEGLKAVSVERYDTSVISTRRSSKDCLVSYEGNYYSVPSDYAMQMLVVKETEAHEVLILSPQGELLAKHDLQVGRHQRSVQAAHYAALQPTKPIDLTPTALQLLPVLLLEQGAVSAPQVEVRSLQCV